MIGYGQTGVTHDFFAYNAAGEVWNGSEFVSFAAGSYTSYRITATETATGSGVFTGTRPANTARYELRVQAGTLAWSYVVWSQMTRLEAFGSANAMTLDSSGRVQVQNGTASGQMNLVDGGVVLQANQPGVTFATVTVSGAFSVGDFSVLNSVGIGYDFIIGTQATPINILERIDVATSTRLASAGYTAPDNAGISTAATQATTAATQATEANTKAGAIQTILAGITSLANWLRAGVRKSTPDSTALSEINSGGGTYDPTTDSPEAIRDRGDAAWASSSNAGTGPNVVTVTTNVGSVKVTLKGPGADAPNGTTSAGGSLTLGCTNAAYEVIIHKDGYTLGSISVTGSATLSGNTVTISGTATVAITLTANTVPSFAEPGKVRAYFPVVDGQGIYANASEVAFTLVTPPTPAASNYGGFAAPIVRCRVNPTTGQPIDPADDDDGCRLMANAVYTVTVDRGSASAQFTTSASGNYTVPLQVLGS